MHNPVDVPPDEDRRQQAVDRSHLLQHKQDPALQSLAGVAADLFQVPMAAITIVDHDSENFLASVGVEADGVPRDISFCAHAILQPGAPTVIPDARHDPRFATNPTVLFAPHIRFYVGVPLMDRQGFALGAFCIMDTKPRPVPDNLLELMLLAHQAERLIACWSVDR